MHGIRTAALAMTIVLTAGIGACCGSSAPAGTGLTIGDQAPPFELPDVYGVRTRSLEAFEGNVVLLNFWASWCMPCQMEMPELEALWTRYQDQGFTIIGVSIDESQRDAAVFLDAMPVSFPVAWDGHGEVGQTYRVHSLPRSILIDREGRVRARYDGFDTATFDSLTREVAGLLEEAP